MPPFSLQHVTPHISRATKNWRKKTGTTLWPHFSLEHAVYYTPKSGCAVDIIDACWIYVGVQNCGASRLLVGRAVVEIRCSLFPLVNPPLFQYYIMDTYMRMSTYTCMLYFACGVELLPPLSALTLHWWPSCDVDSTYAKIF